MRNIVTVSAVFFMLASGNLLECQTTPPAPLFSADQLDNLLAPVALYPDPLLAQLLVAATYPDQITKAAKYTRSHSNPTGIDHQKWNVSVKSVAHYPAVIDLMANQIDWTTSLGKAYVTQPDDVMAAVQRLRAEALAAGNLQSNDEIQVVNNGGNIEIWPAQDQSIYVPTYNSDIYFESASFDFGPPWVIGAWLNLDFDWPSHRIFYHGWQRNEGWITRSRPYIRNLGVYASLGLTNPVVNKAVVRRAVNDSNLSRYNGVHDGVTYRASAPVTRKAQPVKKVNNPAPSAPRAVAQSHASPSYHSAPAHSAAPARSGGGGGHASGGGGGHSGGGGRR
jgi:hypothetical protein